MERAVILADAGKPIQADLLGIGHLASDGGDDGVTSNTESDIESMEEVEKLHISKILQKCHGNKTHAAKKLGLNVRTLRNKIKEYELEL